MTEDSERICQCRRCNGVQTARDAVQYVWEFVLGSCGVPIVVGVNVTTDDFVTCAFTYWRGEPDEPHPLAEVEYIVSCRPGEGTLPSEGDVARWQQWAKSPRCAVDWLIVDGTRFRSVSAMVEALQRCTAPPVEQEVAGDWGGTWLSQGLRERVRQGWPHTVRSARRTSRW